MLALQFPHQVVLDQPVEPQQRLALWLRSGSRRVSQPTFGGPARLVPPPQRLPQRIIALRPGLHVIGPWESPNTGPVAGSGREYGGPTPAECTQVRYFRERIAAGTVAVYARALASA